MYSTIIDISWPISQATTCYKDRGTIEIRDVKTFETDRVRETHITMGSHVGTHIDAPAHFISDGATIDQIPLDACVGRCTVVDLTHISEKITSNDLHNQTIVPGDIILCKTKNSMHLPTDPFDYNFVYLDQSAAHYVAEKKIKAIGIDYLGIERNQPNHETHVILMRAQIGIIEGLRLAHVEAGDYMLIALPIAVVGVEAAQVRAILMR